MDKETQHYQKTHEQCINESRCKTDTNYELTKEVLWIQVLTDILQPAI